MPGAEAKTGFSPDGNAGAASASSGSYTLAEPLRHKARFALPAVPAGLRSPTGSASAASSARARTAAARVAFASTELVLRRAELEFVEAEADDKQSLGGEEEEAQLPP